MKRRVVVSGMGAVSPIGNSVEELWQGIRTHRCGIDAITHFDTADYKVKLAAEVKDLDMEQYFSKRDLKFNDRFTQFARIAAKQAMLDSGLDVHKENMERFGVIIGSGIGGIATEPRIAVLHPDDARQSGCRYGRHRLGSEGTLFLRRHGVCRRQQRDRGSLS